MERRSMKNKIDKTFSDEKDDDEFSSLFHNFSLI